MRCSQEQFTVHRNNSAYSLQEKCLFSAATVLVLCRNSACSLQQQCLFSAGTVPVLCSNSACSLQQQCLLSVATVPVLWINRAYSLLEQCLFSVLTEPTHYRKSLFSAGTVGVAPLPGALCPGYLLALLRVRGYLYPSTNMPLSSWWQVLVRATNNSIPIPPLIVTPVLYHSTRNFLRLFCSNRFLEESEVLIMVDLEYLTESNVYHLVLCTIICKLWSF